MKGKKAQGLSLNMVVIGAIALIILVVILVIFIGGMNPFKKQIKHAPCSKLLTENPNTIGADYQNCQWEPSCNNIGEDDFTSYVTSNDAVAHAGQNCCCKEGLSSSKPQ